MKSGLVYHRQYAGCPNHLSFEEAQKIAIAAPCCCVESAKSEQASRCSKLQLDVGDQNY